MARREITEAEQRRLDRYKQRRDEYVRKLAASAAALSEEDPAAAAELAGLMRDTEPPALPRRRADPARARPGRLGRL